MLEKQYYSINYFTSLLKKENDFQIPQRNFLTDAGYDIISVSDPEIIGDRVEFSTKTYWKRIDYIQYKTNIQMKLPERFHCLIHPRSSISKYNLVLANSIGLIDNEYTGEVLLRFKYIMQPEDLLPSPFSGYLLNLNLEKIYKKGDKIGQLVFEETKDITFNVVDQLVDTQRNANGFGSSGN